MYNFSSGQVSPITIIKLTLGFMKKNGSQLTSLAFISLTLKLVVFKFIFISSYEFYPIWVLLELIFINIICSYMLNNNLNIHCLSLNHSIKSFIRVFIIITSVVMFITVLLLNISPKILALILLLIIIPSEHLFIFDIPLILTCIILLSIYIRFYYFPNLIGLFDMDISQALKKSYVITSKMFIKLLLLNIIIFIFYCIVSNILFLLLPSFIIVFEEISIVFYGIYNSFIALTLNESKKDF